MKKILVHKEIFRLDVSMNNVFGMTEIDCFDQLVYNFFDIFCL